MTMWHREGGWGFHESLEKSMGRMAIARAHVSCAIEFALSVCEAFTLAAARHSS